MFDVGRVEKGKDLLKGLEDVPPLHDIFYKIKGPAIADVLANFVERYNGASIENQYFFDLGIVSEIHEAAERGAKVIIILTSSPDEGLFQGEVESILEKIAGYEESLPILSGHANVGIFTLGNYVPDPRSDGKNIISETYIHSKTMAVIAFIDPDKISSWVARLWAEHTIRPAETTVCAKTLIFFQV